MERIVDWEIHAPRAARLLVEARVRLGLNAQDVAQASGLSLYTYRRMEDSELCTRLPHLPTVESVERLCGVLRVAPAELARSCWTTEPVDETQATPKAVV